MESNPEQKELNNDTGEDIISQNTDEVVVDVDLDTEEPQAVEEDEGEASPALVINIQSWATPIVGLVMLILGLVGGYLLYPQVSTRLLGEAPAAARPTTAAPAEVSSAGTGATATANPGPSDAERQEMMAFLVEQTRHFRGDPEAPVTIIEFSDFQ